MDRTKFRQLLLDVLFPQRCLGCGTGLRNGGDVCFCPACRQGVRLLLEPFCTLCGKPFAQAAGASHLCGVCLGKRWHFARARAVVRYQPPVTEAVKIFKYGGKMHGLATFAALTCRYYEQQPRPQPDRIVPVPLHVKRLRQRGFNQALVLCRKLFPGWRHIIVPDGLERHHWIRPQTGLSGAERRRNVRNAFAVRRPEKIKNRTILLVDDVFTTGATVNECARTLRHSGAARVEVFTFARVVE